MLRRVLDRRTYTLTGLVLVALAALAQQYGWFDGAFRQAVTSQPGLYAVDHFVDGDTVAVKMGGVTETVRMIGIDTPETHKPNTPVQCYGPAAAAYTKNLIGNGRVRLEADSLSQNRDRYDRLLRYVYLADGRLIQAELLKGGYAFAYTSFPFSKSDEFVAFEKQAKLDTKGLWGNCAVTEANGREQTDALD